MACIIKTLVLGRIRKPSIADGTSKRLLLLKKKCSSRRPKQRSKSQQERPTLIGHTEYAYRRKPHIAFHGKRYSSRFIVHYQRIATDNIRFRELAGISLINNMKRKEGIVFQLPVLQITA